MPLLNEKLRQDIRGVLGELPGPVTLTLFTKDGCPTCKDLLQLVQERVRSRRGSSWTRS